MKIGELLGWHCTIDSRIPDGTIIMMNQQHETLQVVNDVTDQDGNVTKGCYVVVIILLSENDFWESPCLGCTNKFKTQKTFKGICDNCLEQLGIKIKGGGDEKR